jgi:hypothetical protein
MVAVCWVDAHANSGWADREDAERWAGEPIEAGWSVGFLVEMTKDLLTLYGSEHGAELGDGLKIPRRWVMAIRVLKKGTGNVQGLRRGGH